MKKSSWCPGFERLTAVSSCSWPAAASEWDDCFEEANLEVVIAACTRTTESNHLQNWQRAMALNNQGSAPSFPDAFISRGRAFHKLGRLREAREDYMRA